MNDTGFRFPAAPLEAELVPARPTRVGNRWKARQRGSLALLVGLLLAAALPSAGAGAGDGAGRPVADSTATTVILVRHAEKNPHPPGGDAGLTVPGLVRAHELARVLADAGIAAVYVSQYGRARLTGEPLAAALGDTLRTYDANRNDRLADRIRAEHRGQTILVVGHSDNLPELIEALTGTRPLAGEAVGYDGLYVLTLGLGGTTRLLRLRYGTQPG